MRRKGLALLLAAAAALSVRPAWAGSGTITVDASRPGPRVPRTLYGVFLEEISHAVEGGLYGELVQNRGFEDANLPPACHLEAGFLVPPRSPHFWTQPRVSDWKMPWKVEGEWPAWSLRTTGAGEAALELVEDEPLNEATPHSLRVAIKQAGPSDGVAVVNGGFWGISVREGEGYDLSFYARSGEGFRGPF